MKTGVSTSACGSRITAARAFVVPHSATIRSDSADVAEGEAGAGLMAAGVHFAQVPQLSSISHVHLFYTFQLQIVPRGEIFICFDHARRRFRVSPGEIFV